MTVLQSIRALLENHGVAVREMHHEPTFTSEQSAQARGEPLNIGGKALLLKTEDTFRLFVMPADRRLDNRAIRNRFRIKKIRFANREELEQLTGLVPGAVPPFGRPILDFDLYVDQAITENDRIAFNAGSLNNSMIMQIDDYLRIANPQGTFAFSGFAES